MPKGIDLHSREYKLLLRPDLFGAFDSDEAVNQFWHSNLEPLIAEKFFSYNIGEPQDKRALERKTRIVRYWDTQNGLLRSGDFTLRERVKPSKDKNDQDKHGKDKHELTLKFRSPDISLAVDICKLNSDKDGEPKFEEDIAPLQILTQNTSGQNQVLFAHPPSMYSRFSVSMDPSDTPSSLSTLQDVLAVYKKLQGNLEQMGVNKLDPNAKLISGIQVSEIVFERRGIKISDNVNAEFTLTLWYHEEKEEDKHPFVAEISFRYDLDGATHIDVARRALSLFTAMQEKLITWIDFQRVGKTDLVLPKT